MTAPESVHRETDSPGRVDRLPRLWGWHTVLSGAAALTLLMLLAGLVNWPAVWQELLACNKGYVFLGAVCHYLTYPVRGLRWRRCLARFPLRGGRGRFAWVVFFYNAVDNVVPGKLGDLYAAHMARINFGIRRSAAIGSIVFLRMTDAWIVLAVALTTSLLLLSTRLPDAVLWSLMGGGAVAVAATTVILVSLFLESSLPAWIPEKIRSMIQAFQEGIWPRGRELLPIFGLTVVIWALESLWIFWLTLGFGLKVEPAAVLFITMVPLLASAFPLTPSGAGVVEVTLFSCLRVLGVAAPLAGSITVLNRFLDYWLHIGLGLVLWAFRRRVGLRSWREAGSVSGTPGPVTADFKEDLS